jgi:hypothetical protein
VAVELPAELSILMVFTNSDGLFPAESELLPLFFAGLPSLAAGLARSGASARAPVSSEAGGGGLSVAPWVPSSSRLANGVVGA